MREELKEKIIVKYGSIKAFSEVIGIPQMQLYQKLDGRRPLRKSEKILIALMLEEDERGLFDEH